MAMMAMAWHSAVQASRNQLPFLSQPLGHRFGNPRAVLHLQSMKFTKHRECKALQGTARHQCTAKVSRSMKHQNCVTNGISCVLHMASPLLFISTYLTYLNTPSGNGGNGGNCGNCHNGLDTPPHDSRLAKGELHQSYSRRSPWLDCDFPNAVRFGT